MLDTQKFSPFFDDRFVFADLDDSKMRKMNNVATQHGAF